MPAAISPNSFGPTAGHAVAALSTSLQRLFQQAGHDVTVDQWMVLMVLWKCDGLHQQEIADAVNKDKTSVTRLLHGLEKRSLVVRIAATDDRRRKRIHLTHKGRTLRTELLALARTNLSRALTGISARDIETCQRVLLRVIQNLTGHRP